MPNSDIDAPATDGFRVVELPGGRRLTVRPATADDAAGLRALYDSLSPDDLNRRFFSRNRPPQRWLEHWARNRDEGGLTLVAVVSNGDEQIVGEVGYALRPDGDGELGLVVAPGWRGWLGPYLLDALLEAAAARGVPNLQADILVENRRMLALVKARGYASPGQEDLNVVRVVIGTGGRPPTWPAGHELPRVLVEGHWRGEARARGSGLQVMACPGPPRGRPSQCPALMGQPCPLAAGADVIVFALAEDDAIARDVLAAHGRVHRRVPLCVDTGSDADGPPSEPAHGVRIAKGTMAADVVELVRELAAGDASQGSRPSEVVRSGRSEPGVVAHRSRGRCGAVDAERASAQPDAVGEVGDEPHVLDRDG
jgi:RimJ/RimL family protein N-acetyltransferase